MWVTCVLRPAHFGCQRRAAIHTQHALHEDVNRERGEGERGGEKERARK